MSVVKCPLRNDFSNDRVSDRNKARGSLNAAKSLKGAKPEMYAYFLPLDSSVRKHSSSICKWSTGWLLADLLSKKLCPFE